MFQERPILSKLHRAQFRYLDGVPQNIQIPILREVEKHYAVLNQASPQQLRNLIVDTACRRVVEVANNAPISTTRADDDRSALVLVEKLMRVRTKVITG